MTSPEMREGRPCTGPATSENFNHTSSLAETADVSPLAYVVIVSTCLDRRALPPRRIGGSRGSSSRGLPLSVDPNTSSLLALWPKERRRARCLIPSAVVHELNAFGAARVIGC